MMNDGSSVENVEWGKTAVRLDHRLKVDKSLLRQIVEEAGLACRLLLILDTKNGFPGMRGVAFPMVDMNCAAPALGANNAYDRSRIGEHNLEAWREWDYAVYIPRISAETWKKYKPYFVYALGHELTHIGIMHQDLCFHRCTSWLFDAFFKKDVVKHELKMWEVPWEEYCNKKGKCIALNIDDESKVQNELYEYAKYLRTKKSEHAKVVDYLFNLDCSDVNTENILSIKKATQALCEQWKKPLLKLWQKERNQCSKSPTHHFELPNFI